MTDLALPKLSSSEETSFKTCRLAHVFQYALGYAPTVTNRKLSVGIGVHAALEALYTGGDWRKALRDWADGRWAELLAAAQDQEIAALDRFEFIKDRDLMEAMVEGYIDWAWQEYLDDGYDIVEVERKHYVEIPGAATILPMKLDLLLRNRETGRLRIVDFKTRASFATNTVGYYLAEQSGNYAVGVFAEFDEVPEMVEYRELRKMAPKTNPKSKPPYFRRIEVPLTREEMLRRVEQYIAISHEIMNPDRVIYANPASCCGSWKNDWQGPCMKVQQGMTPLEALEADPKYGPKDPYQRYDEQEEST